MWNDTFRLVKLGADRDSSNKRTIHVPPGSGATSTTSYLCNVHVLASFRLASICLPCLTLVVEKEALEKKKHDLPTDHLRLNHLFHSTPIPTIPC